MKLIEVTTFSDFLGLEEQWKNVLKRCDHTVFSTWEWLSTWWKHFGYNKQLLILLAEDKGEIVGMAPLMYSVHSVLGLRQGKIGFMGTPHSDYHDFIIADKKEECLKLFVDYLKNAPPKWSVIELTEFSEASESTKILKEMSVNLKLSDKCPYILLPTSHDAFLNSLGYNLRANIRRNSRRLKQAFKVEFIDCSDTLSCDYGMHWFFKLHQKRWTQIGHQGLFADPKFCSFHLEIASSFAKKSWLGLFLLRLSDKPAAAVYGFKYKHKFYFYLQGIDPSYLKYSIGNQLAAYVAGKCIDDQIVEFDFMRGADIYKDRWTATAKWNFQATIPKSNRFCNFNNSFYRKYAFLVANLKFHLSTSKKN